MAKDIEKRIEKLDEKIASESKEKGLVATCQKCGSTDLTMTQNPAKIAYNILNKHICGDCGFEGTQIYKKLKKGNA